MNKMFDTRNMGKRTIRELKLLRYLKHKHLLKVESILLPRSRQSFDCIYITSPLFQSDLSQFLKSSVEYGIDEIKYISYQLLSVLDYLHSSNVIHRHIKPSNILISEKVNISI